MSERILVVEDDPRMADLLRRGLIFEGYQVELAGDGETALSNSRDRMPDLVVLDLMLPGALDGLEVCRRLRAASDVPILVLTARGTLSDKVQGLDSGADDYVVKADFHFEELAGPYPRAAAPASDSGQTGDPAFRGFSPLSEQPGGFARGSTFGTDG